MGILTHLIPIALGFFAKLVAIKSQQAHDQQKLMLEALAAKSEQINLAREQSNVEGPMAAWNRRILMFVILALVSVSLSCQISRTLIGRSTWDRGLFIRGISLEDENEQQAKLKEIIRTKKKN